MAFDVYQLNEQQIELGYFASEVGQSFNNGKFLRIQQEAFDDKLEGDGHIILTAGLESNMLRRTKSGAYAMIAKQVQQIVSVHERPSLSNAASEYDEDFDADVYSQFEALDEEGSKRKINMKDQPVLTYMGAGLSILALLLSSFISATGFTGLFTVLLGAVGFVMAVIGTIQFFKAATGDTRMTSKMAHVVLTVMSLFTLISLVLGTFVMAPAVESQSGDVQAGSSEWTENATPEQTDTETEELSLEELKSRVTFSHGEFQVGKDEAGILRTGLPVTLTNTSDETWTYDITIQAFNTNGDQVGDADFILMAQVAPGETLEFTVFEYITQEEADILAQEGIVFDIANIKAI